MDSLGNTLRRPTRARSATYDVDGAISAAALGRNPDGLRATVTAVGKRIICGWRHCRGGRRIAVRITRIAAGISAVRRSPGTAITKLRKACRAPIERPREVPTRELRPHRDRPERLSEGWIDRAHECVRRCDTSRRSGASAKSAPSGQRLSRREDRASPECKTREKSGQYPNTHSINSCLRSDSRICDHTSATHFTPPAAASGYGKTGAGLVGACNLITTRVRHSALGRTSMDQSALVVAGAAAIVGLK
jgi:hypothetical protein